MAVNWGLANPGGGFDYLQSLQAIGAQAAQRQALASQQQVQQQRDYAFRQQQQQDQARPAIQQRAAAGDFAGAQAQAFNLGDYDALKYVSGLEATHHAKLANEADTIGRLATSLIGLPQEQRAQAFAAVAPQLKQAGFSDGELAGVDLSDAALQQYIKLATDTKDAIGAYNKQQEGYTLTPGSRRFVGGQMVAENPAAEKPIWDSESGSLIYPSAYQGGQGGVQVPAMGAGGPLSAMMAITAQSESGNRDFTPDGRLVTSPAGAQGAMQTMPGTQRDPGFGVAPARDGSVGEKNRVGRDYLQAMMQRYGGDTAKAWAAYNAGPGRVDQAVARGGENWLASMPGETRAYVAKNTRRLSGSGQPGVVQVRAPRQRQQAAPSGYRYNGDRLEPIPGGPADPNTSTQRNVQSNRTAEANYRKEFDNLPEVKTFKTARQQFNTLRDLGTKKNPTPQDDIALIFSYMKTLDPSSVVREGEFAQAQNAAGVPDGIRNMYNKALSGNRLNPDQRQNMVRTAYRNYANYRAAYNQAAENYRGYARDNGINPDRVARTYTPDKPQPKADRMSQFKIVRVR